MDSRQTIRKELQNRPYVLTNSKLLIGLLNDCFYDDKAKVNQLLAAFECGVVNKLLETNPRDEFIRNRSINDITKNYGFDKKTAEWIVDTWLFCMDENVIQAWITHQNQKMEKSKQPEPVEAVQIAEVVSEPPPEAIVSRTDLTQEQYFVNVAMKHTTDDLFVPCGIGNGDNGFFICGLRKASRCGHKYANVYALIYNYLLRNSRMTDADKPKYLQRILTTYSYDYKNIYRLQIMILQMIKNNYVRNSDLEVDYDGDIGELNLAVEVINHYAELFCRLVSIPYTPIVVRQNKIGIKMSLINRKEVFIKQNNSLISNARELWIGNKIYYRLTPEHLGDLEYLLSEISPFDRFKDGQFEALKDMLISNEHSVCIMPTGSGKSLIYYMISILQPLPIFIVSPTDILICDQIRNLEKYHHIDNISHLKLTGDNDFNKFEMCNSLLYLTPTTFLSRHLLVKFRNINTDLKAAYVVLDEIHCLSNWGHDFRAEYLMLSKFLKKFLDRILFIGFTATANYTVIEDIQKQLGILEKSIFSPIEFKNSRISFDFKCVDSTSDMYEVACQILKKTIIQNERTIVFTKSDKVSNALADKIGYEADVFTVNDPSAYHHFAENKCKILIASEELGVGINFRNVHNIVHFGLPVSKSDYVQQIGRAGRSNEAVTSYIVYLAPSDNNIHPILLNRNSEMNDIGSIINGLDNDYSQTYRKFNHHMDSKEQLYQSLLAVYESLRDGNKLVYPYSLDKIDATRKYLYMLYVIGYINDWYSYSMDEQKEEIHILVDVNSSNPNFYSLYENMLRRIKERTKDYFEFMGGNRENIYKVSNSDRIEEVINIYVGWYYTKFLYHHKEQFLDLFSFIESHIGSDGQEIMGRLKDYFSLPFVQVKNDESYFSKLSIKEISQKITEGMSRSIEVNIERINSNQYSYKMDYLLFILRLKFDGSFEKSRIERILNYTSKEEFTDILASVIRVYESCDVRTRSALLREFEVYALKFGIRGLELFQQVFESNPKDLIYFGVMARFANYKFGGQYGK